MFIIGMPAPFKRAFSFPRWSKNFGLFCLRSDVRQELLEPGRAWVYHLRAKQTQPG
jgi:hypothetical protein